jgi:Integrase core domain
VLRRPVEPSQYTAEDYTQVLDDHRVLASVGSVGDCYDNALSESFVDSYKTELIADRVWRTNAQLELATVQYVGWFNHRRLHSSIGNRPPVEHEREYWARVALGLEPGPAQAAPTVSDLRGVATVPCSGACGADRSDCTGPICEEGALELLT